MNLKGRIPLYMVYVEAVIDNESNFIDDISHNSDFPVIPVIFYNEFVFFDQSLRLF